MNADFNVDFIMPQSAAEQLFNRASLREFHGQTTGGLIDLAVTEFSASRDGLDAAIKNTDRLIEMVRAEEMLPEFEKALARATDKLQVNDLERVGKDTRRISTLEDILLVLKAEFEALREMTETTIEETRALQPQIEQGQFVATVLEMSTPFNQAKISLGFGRGITETFMSTACHATIVAVEETWPLGFEFLREAKADSLATSPESSSAATSSADVDASDGAVQYTIGLHDIYYSPLELSIPANEDVTIALPNFGEAPHNLTVDALDISVGVAPGEIGEVTVNAPPGEYEYFCNSPGHRAGGMVGLLVVT